MIKYVTISLMFKRFAVIAFVITLFLVPIFTSPKTAYACSDSWSLSGWSTTGCGSWNQQPTLMDRCSYYYYSTPQEYISKLQEMQSNGATGGCPSTIGQCINQFQNAVPEFQNQLGNLTVSFSANPGSITKGQSSTLSWMAPKAVDCFVPENGIKNWDGSKTFAGNKTLSPKSTTTYKLECYNGCANVSKSTTVTVVNQPPVARLTMTSGYFAANENETLDILGAPASVEFSGSRSSDLEGSAISYVWTIDGVQVGFKQGFTYNNLGAGTHQVFLTVTDSDGATGSAGASIVVTSAILNDPDCKDAYACFTGQSPLNFKWAVDAASSCGVNEVNGIYSKTVSSTGTIEGLVVPNGVHFYKLTCVSNSGGKAERQVRITVK